ncbi:MAG: ABC transporter ATP-binding protein/permease [Clostridia bacterium]|nr:ABC transporter ATP-binding protein/permease [Clostridia bacterium]
MAPGPGGHGPVHFMTDEEKQQVPKVTKALLLRIASYLKPYRLQFALVFIAILLSAAIGLLPSIITGRIVDQALVGKNLKLLVKLLIAAFATMTASQVIGVLESYINAWISSRIIFDMKNQMYAHLQSMPHSFFTSEKQGDIITRMNSDIDGVSNVISGTLTSVVSNVATVVTTIIALFAMSPKLALVGIAIVPLLVIPTKKVGVTRFKLLTEARAKSDEMNQLVDETLSVSGSLLVKLFTKEEEEYKRFVKVNEEVTRFSIKEQRSGQWFRVMMGMFTQVGPLLIYFAGGYLIIAKGDPNLTVGMITATVALINRLYRPVQSLLNIQVDFTRSLALFTRIFDYFDKTNNIKDPLLGIAPDLSNPSVEFQHVAFSYEPGKQILKDINFTVPGGQMYAIVGRSGSGKSTVVNLIPRLYDVDSGHVKVAGIDVRTYKLKMLRQAVGMVSQESYLFNGTIRENLLYAKPDATQEEIESACKIANIHDMIAGLEQGYDTPVGNRGLKLSGGEKQRISLARVVLKDPRILILDEATSALDSISENAIQDAMDKVMEGRTSIVIAHRLSTILSADKILVVDGGVIAESGSHEELLAKDGIYKELYETQFSKVLDK